MPPANRPLAAASVLDRLLDDDPRASQEAPGAGLFNLDQHKRSVARDLEALLNARCCKAQVELLEGYPQARDTCLGFGITDLGSLSMANPDHRMLLREEIRRAIVRFEPRLGQVRVHLEVPGEAGRVLRFRVEALLRLHPRRPPVAFDALLKLSSNGCQVRSQG
jgi:type VI secretion system protein ImpF